MDITAQRYMITLWECGSITKAARALGISQPALSNFLRNLEEQLGTQLVIRSKGSITFTPAGSIYLEGAREMVNIRNSVYDEILRRGKTAKEIIRITGTPNGGAAIFSKIFQHFKSAFPNVTLQFIESYNRQSIELVRSGGADMAICSTFNLEMADIEVICSASKELVLMVPSCFPMGYNASKLRLEDNFPTAPLSSMKDVPFIMPSPDMSYYDGLTELFRIEGFHPEVIFQSANVRVIYNMIRQGSGAGVLPRRMFSPLDQVSPFSFSPKLISYSVFVRRKGAPLTAAQRSIGEYMANYMEMDD